MLEPVVTVVKALASYIAAHPFETLIFILLWWTFSAITSALPTPRDEGPLWYKVIFKFCHTFSGSLVRIEGIRDLLGKFLKIGS